MCQAVPSTCPICKKPTEVKFRPFCSARCANIDLGGWLTEKYAVPTSESVQLTEDRNQVSEEKD